MFSSNRVTLRRTDRLQYALLLVVLVAATLQTRCEGNCVMSGFVAFDTFVDALCELIIVLVPLHTRG